MGTRSLSNVGVSIGLRGCEGPHLQVRNDYRSLDHRIWRVSGPSVPRWAMEALFSRDKVFVQRWGLYWAPRLRGTASPGQERLSKRLIIESEGCPVLRRRAGQWKLCLVGTRSLSNVGVFIGLRGCEGPQLSRSGTTIEALDHRIWRVSGPSAPRLA